MEWMVILKPAVFEPAVIVVLALSLALAVNALRPGGIRLFAFPQTAPAKPAAAALADLGRFQRDSAIIR
jgi:hypothetical protein